MSDNEQNGEQLWEDGWDGHRQSQMRRLARLPMWEKLGWLEEAHNIVRHLQAQRERQKQREQQQEHEAS